MLIEALFLRKEGPIKRYITLLGEITGVMR
jgi:hypothetical protein